MEIQTLIGILGIVCAVWVIYDVWAKQKSMSGGEKIIWTIFAILFSIITAVVYYFVKKK
jgi:hypothetical protein